MLSSVKPEVKLEHNGEALSFSISVFGRDGFQKDYDVFEYINQYWDSLDPFKQQQIFNVYKQIDHGFLNVYGRDELINYLSDRVAELIQLHNLDMIQDWVSMKSDIRVPETIENEYKHAIEKNTSREKTYTKSDYIRLVALSMLLRTMIPVWGQYISQVRQDTGTQFKEYFAFLLINRSNIVNSIPMEKLKQYIAFHVGEDKYKSQNIVSGISSEDYCYWLLALICVRKLCVGDLRGLDPKAHLVTLIYNYILQRIRNNDSDFENKVKPKEYDERTGPDSENKISTLERYKIKANIAVGDIVQLEYSLRNIVDIAHKLTVQIDPNILNRSLHTCQELMHHQLLDPQINLLRWVFKPVISPKGLMYLPKQTIVNALGALEAVLWARGHHYLAIVASSHSVKTDRSEMIVSPQDSKMRVPKELSDELDKLYPFTRSISSKKQLNKEVNLAAKAIDTLSDNLTMFSWRPTADESLLLQVFGSVNRRVPIRPEIKVDLTKLVIEIGSRNWS